MFPIFSFIHRQIISPVIWSYPHCCIPGRCRLKSNFIFSFRYYFYLFIENLQSRSSPFLSRLPFYRWSLVRRYCLSICLLLSFRRPPVSFSSLPAALLLLPRTIPGRSLLKYVSLLLAWLLSLAAFLSLIRRPPSPVSMRFIPRLLPR